uniref:TSA: Tityus bahiensis Tbah02204 mRNA sequence n=1 Tax=Tityus bahiensis TaxID=50343 RepID=A0A0C9QKS6_TITBA
MSSSKIICLCILSLLVINVTAQRSCGLNEILYNCGACDGTCENQTPACILLCLPPSCGCRKGFVRSPNGRCIPPSYC